MHPRKFDPEWQSYRMLQNRILKIKLRVWHSSVPACSYLFLYFMINQMCSYWVISYHILPALAVKLSIVQKLTYWYIRLGSVTNTHILASAINYKIYVTHIGIMSYLLIMPNCPILLVCRHSYTKYFIITMITYKPN